MEGGKGVKGGKVWRVFRWEGCGGRKGGKVWRVGRMERVKNNILGV